MSQDCWRTRTKSSDATATFLVASCYSDLVQWLSPQLYRVLSGLTVKERVLLYGRVFDDQSYKELSLILNVSESALRKRYERLVLKLAQQLDFVKKTGVIV